MQSDCSTVLDCFQQMCDAKAATLTLEGKGPLTFFQSAGL